MSLKVIIIGGGLTGLTAAIALRRIGHSVKVLEKSSFSREVGAAITTIPDATRILESFGVDLKACGGVPCEDVTIVSAETLQEIAPPFRLNPENAYGAPLYSFHRSDLHGGLRHTALDKNGVGPAIELRLSCRVTGYDADTGEVFLADGLVEKGDLIIAADGIHSGAASYIHGHPCPVQGAENTVIRFMISSEVMSSDPVTSDLIRGAGQVVTYRSSDAKRLMLQYDCRDSELQNLALYVSTPMLEGDQDHERVMESSRDQLREAMNGFHPSLIRICDKTNEVLPLWRIADRKPLPKCTKGCLVMIGDASHPMRPTLGQGYGSGVQDVACLQILLDGLDPEDQGTLTERLSLFQSIRQGRSSAIQLYSSVKTFVANTLTPEVQKLLPDAKLPTNQQELRFWMLSYQVQLDTKQQLTSWMQRKQGSK